MALLKTLKDKLKPKEKTGAKLKEKEPVKTEYAGTKKSKAIGLYSAILKKAHVTEKSAHGRTHSQYVFDVARNANKNEIIKAVFALYGIKPVSVNVMLVKGKRVRFGKISGSRTDSKKAIVTLPKGKTISLYEGV